VSVHPHSKRSSPGSQLGGETSGRPARPGQATGPAMLAAPARGLVPVLFLAAGLLSGGSTFVHAASEAPTADRDDRGTSAGSSQGELEAESRRSFDAQDSTEALGSRSRSQVAAARRSPEPVLVDSAAWSDPPSKPTLGSQDSAAEASARSVASDRSSVATPGADSPREAGSRPVADGSDRRPIAVRLRDVVDPVVIENAPFEEALSWWSGTVDIPLVFRRDELEAAGVDLGQRISLRLRRVEAGRLLRLLVRSARSPVRLIVERTPWYVELTPQSVADHRRHVRVYDVSAWLHPTPSFREFSSAFDRDRGQGASVGEGRFSAARARDAAKERLLRTLRETVEPEAWSARGGGAAPSRMFRDQLLVNAPRYVHEQVQRLLGPPVRVMDSASDAAVDSRSVTDSSVGTRSAPMKRSRGRGARARDSVAGVQRTSPSRVQGVQGEPGRE